jgi:DNA-binding NarL/FixJ family response regulator
VTPLTNRPPHAILSIEIQIKELTVIGQSLNGDPASARAPSAHTQFPIHVLLVDDHPAVRHGIRRLIADQPDMVTIAEHSSAGTDTRDVARWADVAVIDYHLGDRDGLWLTSQIKRRPCPPPVLIYSAFADAALAIAAIVAGADGMLPKTTLAEELPVAIRRLVHGRQYFPAIPESITAALSSQLTPSDRPIFSMLMHGVPASEIGARLGVAPAALEARRQLILRGIAPKASRPQLPHGIETPLDYERPRRRWRDPNGPGNR